jgi:flagellar hook protein FlgE
MSLLTSMYSAASGLAATTDELSVVGDNISNSQTVGFKASRTDFADAMTQQLAAGQGEQGLGVRTLTVQKLMSQGAFTTTNQDTDVAIQGNGMFVLKGAYGGTGGTFYSRDGQFTIDKNGYMVNGEGLRYKGCRLTRWATSRPASWATCRLATRPRPPSRLTPSRCVAIWIPQPPDGGRRH